jgi:tRNA(fMet)-specific endonuclease VapC
MYLLDTNTCIHLLNGTSTAIRDRMQAMAPTEILLCSMVKAELLYGAYRSKRVDANLQKLQRFFSPFRCLAFDDHCIAHYAMIRADLAAQGTPIGPNDLVIAAIARAHGAILVTHNTSEFSRVAGLHIEDWE